MTSDTDNDGPSRSQSPDDSGDQENGEATENQDMDRTSDEQGKDGLPKKTASNAKDPLRPRRKKARRACHACQRAHLTCGDERPCQRCIKRGLQDACADGVRKKAKYLHDAPNEALLPGGASHYQYISSLRRPQQPSSPTYPITPVNDLYQHRQNAQSFAMYGSASATNQIPMSESLMNTPTFGTQHSPLSTQFTGGSSQPPSSMQNLVQNIPHSAPQETSNGMPSYEANMFDPHDLGQYNFDPTAFNFGNHYGALEFGMLGHMSSGAAETPPGENGSSLNQNNGGTFPTPGTMSTNYSGSPVGSQAYMYNQDQGIGDWRPPTQPQSNVRQGGGPDAFRRTDGTSNDMIKQEAPHAFSIGIASAFATPTSGMSPQQTKPSFDDLSSTNPYFGSGSAPNSRPSTQSGPMVTQSQPQLQQQQILPQLQQVQHQQPASTPGVHNSSRRRGNPCSIYGSVTQPYSYTTGFHNLFRFLKKRFTAQEIVRIAKALASIRPSFIACTKTLGHEDLVFMEICFQRSLWEYEDLISLSATPTLICRRTGEVAAVGKEFSILTGWRENVLLGKEPNLNVNTGGSSGSATGASSRDGINTPRVPGPLEAGRPQPAFLAELLDDESVVEFYEDFARLAFGDPKGVIRKRCKLLKYKRKNEETAQVDEEGRTGLKRKRKLHGGGMVQGEAGIDDLGDEDGKVESIVCWTVKRDLFDLPMIFFHVYKNLDQQTSPAAKTSL